MGFEAEKVLVVTRKSGFDFGQRVGALVEGGRFGRGRGEGVVCAEEARVRPAAAGARNERAEVRVLAKEGADASGVLGEGEEEMEEVQVGGEERGGRRGTRSTGDNFGCPEHNSFKVGKLLEARLGLGLLFP
jgi:hypothetical protein